MVLLKSTLVFVLAARVSGALDYTYTYLDTATNPFVYLDSQNFTYENHSITTEDGYILLAVRLLSDNSSSISTNATGPPILFVHGFLSEFYDYLNTGPGRALGFDALDAGYDVWLLNTRGSTFSRKHVTLDPDVDKDAFWNFSWHEIGIYDLPVTIDYITNLTGSSNISYVGHSQGTTDFLVLASCLPEYNQKITLAVLLSPVAYLEYAEQPAIVLLKDNLELYDTIVEITNWNEILQHNDAVGESAKVLCNVDSPVAYLCEELYELLGGPSTQINDSMMSVIFYNFPAGSAVKQATHYLQNAHSAEFRYFDYGTDGNEVAYNQTTPPSYNLTAIIAPVALYYGPNDYFVAILDAARLASELPNLVTNTIISYEETNHFDVLSGSLAKTLVNVPVLSLLNEYNNLS